MLGSVGSRISSSCSHQSQKVVGSRARASSAHKQTIWESTSSRKLPTTEKRRDGIDDFIDNAISQYELKRKTLRNKLKGTKRRSKKDSMLQRPPPSGKIGSAMVPKTADDQNKTMEFLKDCGCFDIKLRNRTPIFYPNSPFRRMKH